MRHNILFSAALVAAAFTLSCENGLETDSIPPVDEEQEQGGDSGQVLPDEPDVVTPPSLSNTFSISADETYWRPLADDAVSIFDCWTSQLKYTVSAETGRLECVETSVPAGEQLRRIYAVFPYVETASADTDGQIRIALPSSVSAGTQCVMAASASSIAEELVFERTVALLPVKFTDTDKTIATLKFTGNNGEKIAGPATVTFDADGHPSLSMSPEATSTVTVDCGESGLASGEVISVPLPPMKFVRGFVLEVGFTDGDSDVFTVNSPLEVSCNRADLQTISCKKVKSITIIGDSYSTFKGWNDRYNSGYTCYYPALDVTSVEQMWWHIVATRLGYDIERVNSYSGSTVSYDTYNNTYHGYIHPEGSKYAFIGRTGREDMGDPDVIIVYGGTNDTWCGASQGEDHLSSAADIYKEWTYEQLQTFRPAFAHLMVTLKKNYPDAEIYNITNGGVHGAPGITTASAESMALVCDALDITNIKLPLWLDCIKQSNHPTAWVMEETAEYVIAAIQGTEYESTIPAGVGVSTYYWQDYKTGKEEKGGSEWILTDYIEVPGDVNALTVKDITLYNGGQDGNQTTPVAFYDADMNYMKDASYRPNANVEHWGGDVIDHPVPENAKYVRFCWTCNNKRYEHDVTGDIVIMRGSVNPVWENVEWYVDGHAAAVAVAASKSSTKGSPYCYADAGTKSAIVGKPINRLRFSVANAGTFTYGKYDGTSVTVLGTLTLPKSSLASEPQLRTFEIPTITLAEGETLCFHTPGDVGLFYFTRENAPESSYFASNLMTDKEKTEALNLGIDIGYAH